MVVKATVVFRAGSWFVPLSLVHYVVSVMGPAAGQTDHMQGLDCLMMMGCPVWTIFSRQQNSLQHQALKARQFISRTLNSDIFGKNCNCTVIMTAILNQLKRTQRRPGVCKPFTFLLLFKHREGRLIKETEAHVFIWLFWFLFLLFLFLFRWKWERQQSRNSQQEYLAALISNTVSFLLWLKCKYSFIS